VTTAQALDAVWQQAERSSQARVARAIGVSAATVTRWKQGGEPEGRQRELLLAWAEALPSRTPLRVPESLAQYDAVLATVIATGENRARLGVVQGYAQFVLDQLIELARRQQQVVDGMRPFSEAEGQALAANVTPEQIPEVLASIRRFRARQASGDAPADPRRGTG
jgi:transcriptional regulator with XRE-family HTH domain